MGGAEGNDVLRMLHTHEIGRGRSGERGGSQREEQGRERGRRCFAGGICSSQRRSGGDTSQVHLQAAPHCVLTPAPSPQYLTIPGIPVVRNRCASYR